MPKHFISIWDLSADEAHALLARALEMKKTRHRGTVLDGKVAAMIFEKASTRTRMSFETAVYHLGGHPIFMTPRESQLGRSTL